MVSVQRGLIRVVSTFAHQHTGFVLVNLLTNAPLTETCCFPVEGSESQGVRGHLSREERLSLSSSLL